MKRELFCLVVFTAILYASSTGLAGPSLLGSSQDFAVLGSSTVTNTGLTTIYGSLGVDPGSAITGFPPGSVTGGSIYGSGDPSLQARLDATTAYNTLKVLPVLPAYDLTGQELAGKTLSPGVYYFGTTAGLNGALTLDFASNPGGDFVFKIGTALTTGSGSSVNVINGNSNSGVYWLMGVTGGAGTGSATLGTTTMFAGNILALDNITLTTGADILCGRAIALNGAVTMDTNRISNYNTIEDFGSGREDFGSYGFSGGPAIAPIPAPGALLLVCSGMGSMFAIRKRFFSVS